MKIINENETLLQTIIDSPEIFEGRFLLKFIRYVGCTKEEDERAERFCEGSRSTFKNSLCEMARSSAKKHQP